MLQSPNLAQKNPSAFISTPEDSTQLYFASCCLLFPLGAVYPRPGRYFKRQARKLTQMNLQISVSSQKKLSLALSAAFLPRIQ